LSEPSPLDGIMSASRSNGLAYDIVHEIVASVQSEFPHATRSEVADEVRLRLNRLRRAWRAARAAGLRTATSSAIGAPGAPTLLP
jgi:hypothetical protein